MPPPGPPLSILLTNHALDGRTGSEIVLRDRAVGLARRGHRPVVYSPRPGVMAEEIRSRGVPVVDDLRMLRTPVDLIHSCHHPTLAAAISRFPGAPVLSAHQDFVSGLDDPHPFPNIRRWLASDEAVADRLTMEGGVDPARARILLNAVDLERFRAGPALPEQPRRALAFAKNAGHVAAVRAACETLGLHLEIIGLGGDRVAPDVEAVISRFDIVFASGLSAIEAMAGGRAVVVCDGRGLAGLCDTATYPQWRARNFGLRTLVRPVTAEALIAEVGRYDAADAALVSARVRDEAGLEDALAALEAIYGEVLDTHAREPLEPAAVRDSLTSYLQAWGGAIGLARTRAYADQPRPAPAVPAPAPGPAAVDAPAPRGVIEYIDRRAPAGVPVVSREVPALLSGWVFAPGSNPRTGEVIRQLTLTSDDGADHYAAELGEGLRRQSLAPDHPDDPGAAAWSGFSRLLDASHVPPGRYRLGFAVWKDGTGAGLALDQRVDII